MPQSKKKQFDKILNKYETLVLLIRELNPSSFIIISNSSVCEGVHSLHVKFHPKSWYNMIIEIIYWFNWDASFSIDVWV
jgi:hypothetical protein